MVKLPSGPELRSSFPCFVAKHPGVLRFLKRFIEAQTFPAFLCFCFTLTRKGNVITGESRIFFPGERQLIKDSWHQTCWTYLPPSLVHHLGMAHLKFKSWGSGHPSEHPRKPTPEWKWSQHLCCCRITCNWRWRTVTAALKPCVKLHILELSDKEG